MRQIQIVSRPRAIFLIAALAVFCVGCYPLNVWDFEYQYGTRMVGTSISDVKTKYGQPIRIEKSAAGNDVYVYPYPFRKPVCTIFWEVVNERIVSMRHEGAGCAAY